MGLEHVRFRQVLTRIFYAGMRGRTKATDLRDMVFGVLGLCQSPSDHEIRVDYTLSTRQVFVQAAKTMIAQSGGLDHLTMCDGIQAEDRTPNDGLELPTWVPDWSQASNRDKFWLQIPDREDPYASIPFEHLHRHFTVDEAEKALTVHAKINDRVERKLAESSQDLLMAVRQCYRSVVFGAEHCSGYWEQLRHILSESALPTDHGHGQRRLLQMYLQLNLSEYRTYMMPRSELATLQAELFHEQLRLDCPLNESIYMIVKEKGYWPEALNNSYDYVSEGSVGRFWMVFRNDDELICEHNMPVYNDSFDPPCPDDCSMRTLRAWSMASRDFDGSHYTEMYLTSDGKLLMPFNNVLPGDLLVTLYGCSFPMILRKASFGEDTYQYVGRCFVEDCLDDDNDRSGAGTYDKPGVEWVEIVLV